MTGSNKKIAVFMGTRPEAIKMAPVIKALEISENLQPIIVSTGQHREMFDQVATIFNLKVDHDLQVMQPHQTLASLTSRLMERIDALLEEIRPDFALVQGDTTTVMVASLACFYKQISVGHVEAGLRTNNIYSPFPEEINRRLASPMMALHFAPTSIAESNLLKENVVPEKISVTGNTVVDALFMEIERQKEPAIADKINVGLREHLPKDWNEIPYILVTGHRRENFGEGFKHICSALTQLAKHYPKHRLIYPVHLNPNVQEPVYSLLKAYENIFLIPPQNYSAFITLMKHCQLILTDSGGVQEEAPSLGKPVLVMRDTTERPEGIDAGAVKLVGTDTKNIVNNTIQLLDHEIAYQAMAQAKNPYGDGYAAERIVNMISYFLNSNS